MTNWLRSPDQYAYETILRGLQVKGMIDENFRVTYIGSACGKIPFIDPDLALFVYACVMFGITEPGVLIAAALSIREGGNFFFFKYFCNV